MKPLKYLVIGTIILLVLLLVFSAAIFKLALTRLVPAALSAEEELPTPWPTTVLPPMTPVPTNDGPMQEPPLPPTPEKMPPTPGPRKPFQMTIFVDGFPATDMSTNQADVIVRGTVKQISPARWTTADGKRRENPHARTDQGYLQHTIFRPVLLEVEEYLLGNERRPRLRLLGVGGSIGDDFVEWEPDDLYTFSEGEQVIVFLVNDGKAEVNNSPVYNVVEHYTITEEGQAVNYYHSIPLSQLLAEIEAAKAELGK